MIATKRPLHLPCPLSLLLLAALALFAPPLAGAQDAASEPGALPPAESLTTTQHEVVIGGERVRYTASAGYMPLRTEAGEHKASIFYIAYTRDGAEAESRPITYAYNGGPGSSSVWLHMGALGPRRVVMAREGQMLPPPFRLVDNAHSWLDETDLVFIDPVTTGYSRAADEETAQEFHGLEEDARWVAEFIRLYTTRHERWLSPKFLSGESYGTTRSAAVAGVLQQRHGMYLNGLILISSILDFQTARFDVGNDLPYILFLPTYTATAWYHRRLPEELQSRPLREVLDEVEAFALGDYAQALLQGDRIDPRRRAEIARRLARYTGLPPQYIESTALRVQIFRFTKELLRDQARTVGRLDSRFTGVDRDAAGERFEFDPSMSAILGPYTATLMDYLRGELGFETDLGYEILTGRVQPWSYGRWENRYVNVAETLRRAMSENPHLRVFVGNGYYDLATPYFATEHTFHHMMLDPSLRDNVQMEYYGAGHMMYVHEEELAELKRDVAEFIRAAVP